MLSRRLRHALRSLGLEVTRYPVGLPMHYLVKQLEVNAVSCVLDVGASDGEYALDLRRFGYRGRILSFEPLSDAFRRASDAATFDEGWHVLPYALGPENRTVTIHVAGNSGRSSSLLPMLDAHREALPNASFISTQEVEQRTLDGLCDTILLGGDVVYLKVDVQGYERQVLEGARSALKHSGIRGIQLEMSLVPLYDGAWSYQEALEWAQRNDFVLSQIIPGFTDQITGRMLQIDGVFFRELDGD
jgi:FkbM family methyltransferase